MVEPAAKSAQRKIHALTIALYINAAVLSGILVIMISKTDAPVTAAAWAQDRPEVGGGAGVYVMPAQFSGNTWGCYVLDVPTRTLCAYQYLPGDQQLHFIAARDFKHDLQLSDYNTTPPPQDIADLVRRANTPTTRP